MDIINFRSLSWPESDDFLYLTQVPDSFEPFFVKPDYYCVGMISQGDLVIDVDRNNYGLSPNSLMVYRLMVTQTTKNFNEIPYFLNFNDPFVFSKYFKKHTGLSPKHYRSQFAMNGWEEN